MMTKGLLANEKLEKKRDVGRALHNFERVEWEVEACRRTIARTAIARYVAIRVSSPGRIVAFMSRRAFSVILTSLSDSESNEKHTKSGYGFG